jgi:acetyltransferase-like isoleucine patch superfamily enzyme
VVGYPADRGEFHDLVIGPGARLRSGTMLYLGSCIGAHLETGHNVIVREDCQIADDVSIWSNSVVDYGCRIGNGVKIHANCYIAQYTDIEDGAFLAPGVTIANDLYPGQPASAKVMCGPSIGAGAQIGVNVTILPFVRIGAGALIGAGAVVVLDIPDGCVAFGNPAVVRGRVGDLRSVEKRIRAVATRTNRYRLSAPHQAHLRDSRLL